jgi:hypothetical protein
MRTAKVPISELWLEKPCLSSNTWRMSMNPGSGAKTLHDKTNNHPPLAPGTGQNTHRVSSFIISHKKVRQGGTSWLPSYRKEAGAWRGVESHPSHRTGMRAGVDTWPITLTALSGWSTEKTRPDTQKTELHRDKFVETHKACTMTHTVRMCLTNPVCNSQEPQRPCDEGSQNPHAHF